MAVNTNVLDMEINAKFLWRNNFFSLKYAEQKMARIRKTLGLARISVKSYCDFYKIDPSLFTNAK